MACARILVRQFGSVLWISLRRKRSSSVMGATNLVAVLIVSIVPENFCFATYQAYLRHQVGSPATEYRKLSALRSFFKYLKLTNEIAEDLSLIIKTPKVESNFKAKALSVDEIQAIIEAAKPNPLDSLLLRLLYVTGGRISEVLALTWSHLKPAETSGGYAHILGKGKKEREVYIGPELWADLA